MIKVAIAGKFDPLHEGHIDHIKKASKLGDCLIAITHRDEIVAKHSKKGLCYKPLVERMVALYEYPEIDMVIIAGNDKDGTVTNALRTIKPDIFAKGGDRTPDNMPAGEIKVCEELGIKIVYGVGDLLNSSSDLVEKGTNADPLCC